MMRYSSPLFGIRTTTLQVASSSSCPSWKATCTRATTIYHYDSSDISISVIFTASIPTASVSIPVSVPGSVSPVVSSAASASISAFQAYFNHPPRCSAIITEGLLNWLVLNLPTAQYISSYIGTESSTWNDSMGMGLLSFRGGTWQYSMTRSAVILLRVT